MKTVARDVDVRLPEFMTMGVCSRAFQGADDDVAVTRYVSLLVQQQD